MRRFLPFLLLLPFLALLASSSHAGELLPGQGEWAARLPLVKQVEEVRAPGFLVRVFIEETTKGERFHVALATWDESPETRLYSSEKAGGWRYLGWDGLPLSEEADQHFSFRLLREGDQGEPLAICRVEANFKKAEIVGCRELQPAP